MATPTDLLGIFYENFIRKAVTLEVSANEALKILQDSGLGYRRSEFLSDYRAAAGLVSKISGVRNVNKDKLISQALYTATSYLIPNNFRYSIRLSVTSDTTGETFDMYRWVGSNEQLMPGVAEAEGQKAVEDAITESNVTINSRTLIEAQVRSDFNWSG